MEFAAYKDCGDKGRYNTCLRLRRHGPHPQNENERDRYRRCAACVSITPIPTLYWRFKIGKVNLKVEI